MSSHNVCTPEARLSFPHVFDLDANGKYSVVLFWAKNDPAFQAFYANELRSIFEAATTEGMAKMWGGHCPPNMAPNVRDSNEPNAKGKVPATDFGYGDSWYMNISSSYIPAVVDRNGQKILESDAVYGGLYCDALIHAYPYSNKGNCGISWGITALRVIRDGDRFGNSADLSLFRPLPAAPAGVPGQSTPRPPAFPAQALGMPGQSTPRPPAFPAQAQAPAPAPVPAPVGLPSYLQ